MYHMNYKANDRIKYYICRTKQKSNKDAIVMEMKTDKSDEAVLLQGVNGEKKAP